MKIVFLPFFVNIVNENEFSCKILSRYFAFKIILVIVDTTTAPGLYIVGQKYSCSGIGRLKMLRPKYGTDSL